jgi:hypothetical protein
MSKKGIIKTNVQGLFQQKKKTIKIERKEVSLT